MLIDLTFKGEKATYEFASALSKFGNEVLKVLGDGFQPIEDITQIGAEAWKDLLPVAKNVALFKGELAEDKVAFINSWAKAGEEFYDALVAK